MFWIGLIVGVVISSAFWWIILGTVARHTTWNAGNG